MSDEIENMSDYEIENISDYEIEIMDDILTLTNCQGIQCVMLLSNAKILIQGGEIERISLVDGVRSIAYPTSEDPQLDVLQLGFEMMQKKKQLVTKRMHIYNEKWVPSEKNLNRGFEQMKLKVPKETIIDKLAVALCRYEQVYRFMPQLARSRAEIRYQKQIEAQTVCIENCVNLIRQEMTSLGVERIAGLNRIIEGIRVFTRRHGDRTIEKFEDQEKLIQAESTDGLIGERQALALLFIELEKVFLSCFEIKKSQTPDGIETFLIEIGLDELHKFSHDSIKKAISPARSRQRREKMKNSFLSGI